MPECRYCERDYQRSDRSVLENELFFANYDNHPVSRGHMKIIPKRHIDSLASLTGLECIALLEMIQRAKALIDHEYHPDGYNIGDNEGEAAGQTVFHLHIHVIPRYYGDVKNPVGGIRNIIPGRGDYREGPGNR